jgi:hypothetical protein
VLTCYEDRFAQCNRETGSVTLSTFRFCNEDETGSVTFITFREVLTCYEDRFAQCNRERRPKKLRAPRSNLASLRTSWGDSPCPACRPPEGTKHRPTGPGSAAMLLSLGTHSRLYTFAGKRVEDMVGARRQRPVVEGEHDLMVFEWQALAILHAAEPGMLVRVHHHGATGPDCVRVSGTFRGCGDTGHQHCYGHDSAFQAFHISHAERYTTEFVENRGLNEIVEGAIRCTWAAILMGIICLYCSDEAPYCRTSAVRPFALHLSAALRSSVACLQT